MADLVSGEASESDEELQDKHKVRKELNSKRLIF